MLKKANVKAVKNIKSPSKSPKGPIVKAKAVAKKNDKSKTLKATISPKVAKEIVEEDTLAGRTQKLLQKKPLDKETLAARKAQIKQKKKLKTAAAKAAKKVQVQQETTTSADTASPKQISQANGVKTNETVAAKVASKLTKKEKKKEKKEAAAAPNKAAAGTLSPEKTVFVGNLPTNTKRVQIMKLFNSCGPITAIRIRTASGKVIFKHKARRAAGSLNAYITLQDADAVAKALELNGVIFKDFHLRVTKTDPAETVVDPKRMVFVGNLKYSANDEKLRQIFSSCGEIDYVRTLQDPKDAGCKGVAFVCFKEPNAAGLALELKGTILDDRPINVERYSVSKLGAKSKRDADIQKSMGRTPHKGKPMQKGKLSPKGKSLQKNNKVGKKDATSEKNGSVSEKKKKSEFRGAKSQVDKKKSKKKIPTGMKKLALKIAPRSDN